MQMQWYVRGVCWYVQEANVMECRRYMQVCARIVFRRKYRRVCMYLQEVLICRGEQEAYEGLCKRYMQVFVCTRRVQMRVRGTCRSEQEAYTCRRYRQVFVGGTCSCEWDALGCRRRMQVRLLYAWMHRRRVHIFVGNILRRV